MEASPVSDQNGNSTVRVIKVSKSHCPCLASVHTCRGRIPVYPGSEGLFQTCIDFLKAVITQVLVKTPDGRGRRAVLEILVNTRAISKLIQTDQTHQIPSQLQTGKDLGMQLMDQGLLDAINAKEVDADDAIRFASEKRKFQRFVTDTDLFPTIDIGDQSKV